MYCIVTTGVQKACANIILYYYYYCCRFLDQPTVIIDDNRRRLQPSTAVFIVGDTLAALGTAVP